jgi:transcriptional regulator with PAS, ATPase and Fis domain
MKTEILFCWLGATDLKAASEQTIVGLGPVAQAIDSRQFAEVILLNNWQKNDAESYATWLRKRTSTLVTLVHIQLSRPTDFGEICQAASVCISQTLQKHGEDSHLVYHLSPGTPAMAAVWILLAKARFPAELIESSKEHGVRSVNIPFDISTEFFPDLFKKSDKTLERLASGLPATAPEFADIVHRSEVMQRVVLKARRIAPRSIPVLIEGESGTGKELFARAIHDASPRREMPFIAINCGAIPSELVESELFGHEKGAFTGATAQHLGHFEMANNGTIFLDEVGELPKKMQVKLLRTLQEKEIRRIGSSRIISLNTRIIAATNRSLIDEVSTGTFREDLFYRLAVAVLKLPPLRERAGDLTLLIDTFMRRINQQGSEEPGYKDKNISVLARNLLLHHSWPGNVRELQNTLTRAAIWSIDEELSEDDIRDALLPVPFTRTGNEGILNRPLENGIDLPRIIQNVAVHYLERGLAKTGHNKTRTAKLMGLSNYQTLTNWLKKYGLEK